MAFLDDFTDALTKRYNQDLSRIGVGNAQPTNQQVTNQPLINPNQQPTADTAQYQYVAPQQPQMQNVVGMGSATGTGLTIPGAPQFIQPVAPQQVQPQQVQQQPQMQQPQMQPAVAPAPNPARPIINDQGQVVGQETPQQMVQGAQTNAPVANAPVAPGQPQMQPVSLAQPPVNENVPTTPTAQQLPGVQAQPHIDAFMQAQGNPNMMSVIANDRRTEDQGGAPSWLKQAANRNLAEHYQTLTQKNDAEKRLTQLVSDAQSLDTRLSGPATREIAKEMAPSRKEDEGSYFKAYLYRRFGLADLAQQEQAKLGAGSTMQQITLPSGDTALVRMRSDGVAQYGHNTKTGQELDAHQLEEASGAYRKGATTGHTLYTDKNGHVITLTTVPGQANPIFFNSTTGQSSTTAPEGLKPLSQIDYREKMADQAATSTMSKMRAENIKATGQGAQPVFTDEQIKYAGDQARIAAYHGIPQGGPSAGIPTTAPTAPAAPTPGATVTPPPGQTSGQINNNPGNIMYGDKAVSMGATGKAPNGTAIFPSMAVGDAAHDQLLGGAAYKNLNLHQIISKWAPNTQNNPAQYSRTVQGMLGNIDMNKTYNELTPAEKQKFREVQYRVEHGGEPGVPNVSGAEPIKSPIRQQAESIYNGDIKMPTGMGANNYRSRAIQDEVQKIAQERGKPFDPTVYDQRLDTEKKFNTGKQGDTVRSMNVAVDHLDTLKDAATALNNGDMPLFNKIANEYSRNTGSPKVTNFDGIKSIVGSEVAKAVSGAGGSALGDRDEIRKEIDAANSPQQLEGVIKKYQQLMAGQIKGLENQYKSGHGRDWDSKVTDRTKRVLTESQQTRSNW